MTDKVALTFQFPEHQLVVVIHYYQWSYGLRKDGKARYITLIMSVMFSNELYDERALRLQEHKEA